jgi:hypothetical protein
VSIKLRNISRYFESSFAGIRNDIKIVVPEQVASYNDDLADGGITVTAGNTIYEVTADPRSASASEQLADGTQGHSHRRGLRFRMRRVDQDKTELRTLLMNRRVHLIFTDENCQTYVYLNMKMDTGTKAENGQGVNRTDMSFSGASRFPAPFINAVLLPAQDAPEIGVGVEDGIDVVINPTEDGVGIDGGGPDDDIGGPTTDPGDGDGDGTDPPTVPSGRAVARKPSTGELREIIIDACDGFTHIPYVE